MSVPKTVRKYLDEREVRYEVLPHPYTSTSLGTAEASHISGEAIAKSVLLEDENGYLMAVIPATHHIELGKLGHQLNKHLGLATEEEVAAMFKDCDLGAIPAIGQAYNIAVVVEDSLYGRPDVYFESGDHTDLIHVSGNDFQRLMADAYRGSFSRHL